MTIEEKSEMVDEQFSSPLAYVFEENIPDDCVCISWKFNTPKLDEDEIRILIRNIIKYMKEYTEIISFTHGFHKQGKSKIPHYHVHFIVQNTDSVHKMCSNKSQHRSRYKDYSFPKHVDLKMRDQPLEPNLPKFNFLAYPMKEGKYINNKDFFQFDNAPMTTDMKQFLIKYAEGIFNQKIANDLANERCEERKEIRYAEILKVAKNFNGDTFRDYQIFMEEKYIEPIIEKGENIPDIDNYKKNIRRAAVQLRFFKTYEI